MKRYGCVVLLAGALLMVGCSDSDAPAPVATGAAPAAPTNRVDIPLPVRRNLGITFASVERRNVASTMRLPGRFELVPGARREHRAAAPGRVELAVDQYQRVEVGEVLYRLDSPRWRELQQQIARTQTELEQALARQSSMEPLLQAHSGHRASLEERVRLWTSRLQELEAIREAGGGRQSDFAQARTELSDAEAELAETVEKFAELNAEKSQIEAQVRGLGAQTALLLQEASSLSGVSMESLQELDASGEPTPRWARIRQIEVRATAPGVVEAMQVTTGSAVEETALILTTVRPEQVRFRATAPQSDLGRLHDGLTATITAPAGGSGGPGETLAGVIQLGLHADAESRTVDVLLTPTAIAPWAREGVSATLDVVLEGGVTELAIPQACVVRDGVTPVIFRRDPADADKVIRLPADLGVSDGHWVVVQSGVKAGDEIVLDGAYQLMLATAGNAPKGGHFHADGTFHEEAH